MANVDGTITLNLGVNIDNSASGVKKAENAIVTNVGNIADAMNKAESTTKKFTMSIASMVSAMGSQKDLEQATSKLTKMEVAIEKSRTAIGKLEQALANIDKGKKDTKRVSDAYKDLETRITKAKDSLAEYKGITTNISRFWKRNLSMFEKPAVLSGALSTKSALDLAAIQDALDPDQLRTRLISAGYQGLGDKQDTTLKQYAVDLFQIMSLRKEIADLEQQQQQLAKEGLKFQQAPLTAEELERKEEIVALLNAEEEKLHKLVEEQAQYADSIKEEYELRQMLSGSNITDDAEAYRTSLMASLQNEIEAKRAELEEEQRLLSLIPAEEQGKGFEIWEAGVASVEARTQELLRLQQELYEVQNMPREQLEADLQVSKEQATQKALESQITDAENLAQRLRIVRNSLIAEDMALQKMIKEVNAAKVEVAVDLVGANIQGNTPEVRALEAELKQLDQEYESIWARRREIITEMATNKRELIGARDNVDNLRGQYDASVTREEIASKQKLGIVDEQAYKRALRIYDLKQELLTLETKLQQLQSKQETNKQNPNTLEGTATFERTQKDIQNTTEDIASVQQELRELGVEFENVGDKGTKCYSVVANAFSQLIPGGGQIATIINSFGKMIDAQKEVGANAGEMGNSVVGANGNMSSSAAATASAYIALAKVILDWGKQIITTFINDGKKAFSYLKQGVIKIISIISRLGGAFKDAGSKVSSLFSKVRKGVDKSTPSLKKIFNMLLKYGIGIRSFYVLFRKLRTMVQEGFKDVAKVSDRFNIAISNIKSSWAQLKGQVSAMIEPIVVALEPLLTMIIEKLTEAALAVTKFFGALTGMSKVLKATKIWTNYADSLSKANKQLAGFDELNNLTSNSGGNGDDFTNGWEWVDSEFPDWWKKLQEQWEQGNYDLTWLGEEISNNFVTMLQEIDWENIFAQAASFATGFATFLNGVFANEQLMYEVGKTIANGINTAFTFLSTFVSTFDFSAFGNAIGDALLTFMDTINFPQILFTLTTGFDGILKAISSFFSTVSLSEYWSTFGTNIGEALESIVTSITDFVNNTDWVALITTITNSLANISSSSLGMDFGDLFNALFTNQDNWGAIKTFVSTMMDEFIYFMKGFILKADWNWFLFDLGQVITSTSTSIARFIDDLFAILFPEDGTTSEYLATFATNLIKGINTILGALADNLNSDSVQTAIQSFFENVDWGGLLNTLTYILVDIIEAIPIDQLTEPLAYLLRAFGTAGMKVWAAKRKLIADTIWKIFITSITESGAESEAAFAAGYILKGLGLGLLTGVKIVLGFIITVVAEIIAFFCQLFGIHSPSTVAMEWGVYIMQGLGEGIANAIQFVLDKITTVFGLIKAFVFGKFELFKATMQLKFNAFKDMVVTVFEQLKDAIKVPINGIIGFINGLVGGVCDGINKVIEALNSTFVSPPDWLTKIVSKMGADIGDAGFSIPPLTYTPIPQLAQGAVIPANKPFLAQLGDQRNGLNIETPLSTMIEAFNTALAQNGSNDEVVALMSQQIQLLGVIADRCGITDKQIFNSVQSSANTFRRSTGRSAF